MSKPLKSVLLDFGPYESETMLSSASLPETESSPNLADVTETIFKEEPACWKSKSFAKSVDALIVSDAPSFTVWVSPTSIGF